MHGKYQLYYNILMESCENNDLTFASFCRALDAIISYHFTREIERHMQMIYGFGANCLEQLSALGNIFITVRPLRFVYRTISYAFYRILFVFYSIVGHKSRVVNWIWNLVAVICILFITYSHFLTICCTLLLAASGGGGGDLPLAWYNTRIFGPFSYAHQSYSTAWR